MVVLEPSRGGTPSRGQREIRDERAAGEIVIILLMFAMVAMTGLVVDSGMAFNAGREANNIASTAARAAANAVDTNRVYDQGSAWIDHDSAAGAAASAAYAAGAETVATDLDPDKAEVTVTVTMTHDTVLLAMVGIDSFFMTGEGTARLAMGTGP